jgi:hypothetical protein
MEKAYKKYCYNCNDFINIVIKEEKCNIKIKKDEIIFNTKMAYCKNCNKRIHVNFLEDELIKKANKIYRDKKNIIQISEIELLLKKYAIGHKPLSNLLEWGENTIGRYLKGLTPNIEYSNKLKSLFNIVNMEELLEKNKDYITKIAYKKIKNSIDKLRKE